MRVRRIDQVNLGASIFLIIMPNLVNSRRKLIRMYACITPIDFLSAEAEALLPRSRFTLLKISLLDAQFHFHAGDIAWSDPQV
jgi:hypothetical protein